MRLWIADWEKTKSLFGIDRGRLEILDEIIESVDAEWEAEEA